MGKSSVRALVALGALMVVAACSSSKGSAGTSGAVAPVDLSVKVTDAPTTGGLAGTVVDEDGVPIAGATVNAVGAVGTVSTTTDGSGAFALAPTPGRVQLQISAMGRVPFSRSIGVTSISPTLRFKLVTAGAAQKIMAAGGTVKAGDASLVVPNGAYPSGASITATWIDRAHVSGATGRPLFVDDVARYRFVGQLSVDASSEPASPVTLQVPVPAGMPSDEALVAVAIVNGEIAGAQLAPTGIANGVASFALPHLSTWTVMRRRLITAVAVPLAAAWVVLDVINDGANALAARLEVGQDLPPESEVSDAVVVAPNGAQVYLDAHVSTIHTDDDGTTSSTCIELCNVQADVPPTPAAPPGKTKYQIRTKTAALGCRGTVFSVRQKACSVADGSAIDTVEVSEGDVDFNVGGADYDVPAGKQAEGCDGCKDPKQAVCDCDVKACEAAGGMCDPCIGKARGYVTVGSGLGGISSCVEKGSLCCLQSTMLLCLPSQFPGYAITCQCAGSQNAGCATSNSACGANGIVDCGAQTLGKSSNALLLCSGDDPNKPSGDGFHCLNPGGLGAFPTKGEIQECGACGNICPSVLAADGTPYVVCRGGRAPTAICIDDRTDQPYK